MLRVQAAALLVAFIALGSAPGANDEGIKADLKAGKYKPAFEGGSDLVGYNDSEEKAFFYTNGSVELTVKVPDAAEYTITVKASCNAALKENAKFNLSADGKQIAKEFELKQEDEKEYPFTAKLEAGERKIKIEYTNDVYKENEYDRNLYVHAVTLKKK